MNKAKLLLTIIAVFITIPTVSADAWDDFSNLDNAWDGQKTITNQEFEEVIEALEAKDNQKKEKKRKKLIRKIGGGGTSLHEDLGPNVEIKELGKITSKKEDGILVNIPVNIVLNGNVLEKGFYKVIGERDNNNRIFISFYQSQFFKGKIEVQETESDFEQDKIDFAELLPYNDSFVKMIFGCLDFNAYTFIPYIEANF
jgi:hypothetical protein